MSDLLVRPKAPDSNGCILNVTPKTAAWDYVGFAVHALSPGAEFDCSGGDREICIVVLTGSVTVRLNGVEHSNIGGRESVFDGPPEALYVPWKTTVSIVAESSAEVAICSAPGGGNYEARLISAGTFARETRGTGANTRYVQDILPESAPAHSLLVVEVVTPSGNWSSYPPHKHDQSNPPAESALEETYYHRLNPKQGFAFQRVYTDDRGIDETLTVEDGDCVMVPGGYHPVGTPYGYDLYYLNVMAGPTRQWVFNNDPHHAWILD